MYVMVLALNWRFFVLYDREHDLISNIRDKKKKVEDCYEKPLSHRLPNFDIMDSNKDTLIEGFLQAETECDGADNIDIRCKNQNFLIPAIQAKDLIISGSLNMHIKNAKKIEQSHQNLANITSAKITQEVYSITSKIPKIFDLISEKETIGNKISIIPKIWEQLLWLGITSFVSGFIFPVKAYNLGIGMDSIHGNPLIILIGGVGSLFGTILYKVVPFHNDWAVRITHIIRHAIFLALYTIAVNSDPNSKTFYRSLYFIVPLLISASITNGYIFVQLFGIAANRCNNEEKKLAGFMMSFGVYIGLIFGSVIIVILGK